MDMVERREREKNTYVRRPNTHINDMRMLECSLTPSPYPLKSSAERFIKFQYTVEIMNNNSIITNKHYLMKQNKKAKKSHESRREGRREKNKSILDSRCPH
jgi:hypothetical protein